MEEQKKTRAKKDQAEGRKANGLLSPNSAPGASPTSSGRGRGWRGLSVGLITGDPDSVAEQLNGAVAKKDKGKARDTDSDSDDDEDGSPPPRPAAKAKAKAKAKAPVSPLDSDAERSLRAMMDIDDGIACFSFAVVCYSKIVPRRSRKGRTPQENRPGVIGVCGG